MHNNSECGDCGAACFFSSTFDQGGAPPMDEPCGSADVTNVLACCAPHSDLRDAETGLLLAEWNRTRSAHVYREACAVQETLATDDSMRGTYVGACSLDLNSSVLYVLAPACYPVRGVTLSHERRTP